jgi:hypothetical protein
MISPSLSPKSSPKYSHRGSQVGGSGLELCCCPHLQTVPSLVLTVKKIAMEEVSGLSMVLIVSTHGPDHGKVHNMTRSLGSIIHLLFSAPHFSITSKYTLYLFAPQKSLPSGLHLPGFPCWLASDWVHQRRHFSWDLSVEGEKDHT